MSFAITFYFYLIYNKSMIKMKSRRKSLKKKSRKKSKKSRGRSSSRFCRDGTGDNKRSSDQISKTPQKNDQTTPPTSTNQPIRKKIKTDNVFVRLYNNTPLKKIFQNKDEPKKNMNDIKDEISTILNLHGYFPEYSDHKIFENYINNEKYDGYSRDAFEFLGDRVLKYIQGLISFENSINKNPSSMTQFNVQLEKNYTFNCYLRHGIGNKDICNLMGITLLSATSNEKKEKIISKKCADLFESLIGSIFYFYYKKEKIRETEVFKKIRDWLYDQTPFEENVKYLKNIQTTNQVLFKQTDENSAPSYHFCETLKKKKKDEENRLKYEENKVKRLIRFKTT
jgi:dsRNA-specific ribonuclease